MQVNILFQRIRKTTIAATLLLVAGAALPAFGDPPGEEDHDELRAMLILITKAHNEGNFDILKPILAESFVFTGSDQITFTSLEEIKNHFKKLFDSEDSPVTGLVVEPTAAIKTRFTDDNNGYCYGNVAETYSLRSGGQVELNASWTGTVTKVDGKWKVSTAHVGIHFMENPVVEMIKEKLFKWVLIGGLVVGVVIGALLSMFIARKKRRSAAPAR